MMKNPNIVGDDLHQDASPEGMKLGMESSAGLQKLLKRFSGLHETLMTNRPVTQCSLQILGEDLKNIRFVIGDTSFTAEEIRKNPKLQQTLKMWQEIENEEQEIQLGQGTNFYHHKKLLYLNDHVAKILANAKWTQLDFENLLEMTDEQAKSLSTFRGSALRFTCLQKITDHQTDSLARFHGNYLTLSGIRELTDPQAASLAEFSGCLTLYWLQTLTDHQAALLGQFKGTRLGLNPDISLSTKALRALYPLRVKMDSFSGDVRQKIELAGPPRQS